MVDLSSLRPRLSHGLDACQLAQASPRGTVCGFNPSPPGPWRASAPTRRRGMSHLPPPGKPGEVILRSMYLNVNEFIYVCVAHVCVYINVYTIVCTFLHGSMFSGLHAIMHAEMITSTQMLFPSERPVVQAQRVQRLLLSSGVLGLVRSSQLRLRFLRYSSLNSRLASLLK